MNAKKCDQTTVPPSRHAHSTICGPLSQAPSVDNVLHIVKAKATKKLLVLVEEDMSINCTKKRACVHIVCTCVGALFVCCQLCEQIPVKTPGGSFQSFLASFARLSSRRRLFPRCIVYRRRPLLHQIIAMPLTCEGSDLLAEISASESNDSVNDRVMRR